MPTWRQVYTYLAALHNLWVLTGGRLVSKEVIDHRFNICKDCEHFSSKGCAKCGCCIQKHRALFNKLAFPNEKCPVDKWLQITPENPFGLVIDTSKDQTLQANPESETDR